MEITEEEFGILILSKVMKVKDKIEKQTGIKFELQIDWRVTVSEQAKFLNENGGPVLAG